MDGSIEERLRGSAPSAFEGEGVLFAYLFGSHAGGRPHARSDVDVAVYVDPSVLPADFLKVRLRLAQAIAKAARLRDVEVIVLNEAPLPLAGRVIRNRRVLYSTDEPARVRYESRTFREFVDFDRHAREIDRALLRATAEGRR
jgi:hypothetical protein